MGGEFPVICITLWHANMSVCLASQLLIIIRDRVVRL